jgi:hypothetical protein
VLHGEGSYAEMIEHFAEYNDVAGDSPLNLCHTSQVHPVMPTGTWAMRWYLRLRFQRPRSWPDDIMVLAPVCLSV